MMRAFLGERERSMLSWCPLEKKIISLCVCLAHLQPCIEEQNLSFLFSFSGVFEWVNTEKFWFSYLINCFVRNHPSSSSSHCRSCSTAQKRQARPAFAASSGLPSFSLNLVFFNFLLKSTGFLYSTSTFFFSPTFLSYSLLKSGWGRRKQKVK